MLEGLPAVADRVYRCGYTRLSYTGDVGDYWEEIFDQTNTLVYTYHNGASGGPCRRPYSAGVEPYCEEWTTVDCTVVFPQPAVDAGGPMDIEGGASD